ncbi:DUF4124 domain-containing protein [Motilimonas pumila]|uniref:DUF4124 domain-containing protein n=1 Tax=Motilimonas pumila TaxID=2303987 RepID=A0A418YEA7_9GAMM|nr:DUF4124 domain-containing protein [Motilimonas pumila]RJG47436.1 DUF4124 domain-containing protein [Motilimonas pumila]
MLNKNLKNLLFFVFILFSGHLKAAVYSCDVDGKKVYQDIPCTDGKYLGAVKGPKQIVGGFHKTWFLRPAMLPSRPTCNQTACLCDGKKYPYKTDEWLLVMNAMAGLPSSWNMHQSYAERQKKHDSDALREGTIKYACDVAMKQEIVRKFYDQVANKITADSQSAEEAFEKLDKKCDKLSKTSSDDAEAIINCYNGTRVSRNKALRSKKRKSSDYKYLMSQAEILKKAREIEQW